MRAVAMSIDTTSSMSVTQSVPPRLRMPLGALRPVTHFALTILPSGDRREM